ncbi:hypothetical protein ACQJBY_005317 [Aegilops geniculata]
MSSQGYYGDWRKTTPWSPERVRGRRTSNTGRRSQPLHPFCCLGWKTNPTSPHLTTHQPTLCINCVRCRRLAETTGPDPRIGTGATPRATAHAISLDAVRPSVHSWPICQASVMEKVLLDAMMQQLGHPNVVHLTLNTRTVGLGATVQFYPSKIGRLHGSHICFCQ